jgi:hypothetical protein
MKERKRNYVVCIRAEQSTDIEVRKVYEVLPDESAAKRRYLRIVDESGEDYLYPQECFVPIQLPEEAVRALASLVPAPGRANKTLQPPSRARR